MSKCKHCGVTIKDHTQVCPLCNGVLPEFEERAEDRDFEMAQGEDVGRDADAYPDIKIKTRLVQRIGRIAIGFLILIEAILIVINYYTYSGNQVRWSIITGGAILYLIITMRDLVNHRTGHIQKIYLQIIGAIALIFCIDYALGFSGWSLEIGFPCVIFSIDLIIVVCMVINMDDWQNYLLLQIFTVILSFVNLILYWLGVVHNTMLVWFAFGATALLWAGTVIVGDRKAATELKRKFHI